MGAGFRVSPEQIRPLRDFDGGGARILGVASGRTTGQCSLADPPYFGSEEDYGRELLGRGDFAKVAERFPGCRGRKTATPHCS